MRKLKVKKFEINGLKYPYSDKIRGRASTMCRSMASTILRRDPCSVEDEEKWKRFFPAWKCAYCGDVATQLDHLRPYIVDRQPTGYGSEPANLVPCCGRCNQKKGNKDWEEFINSDKCKHLAVSGEDLKTAKDGRIQILRRFQEEMRPHRVEISQEYLREWNGILKALDDALRVADKRLLQLKEKFK